VMVKSSLVPFDCTSLGAVRVLESEPTVVCDPAVGPFGRMRAVAAVAIVVYVLGLPAALAVFLKRSWGTVQRDQRLRERGEGDSALTNPHFLFRRRFRKIYEDYRPAFAFWKVFILLRKLGLGLVVVLANGCVVRARLPFAVCGKLKHVYGLPWLFHVWVCPVCLLHAHVCLSTGDTYCATRGYHGLQDRATGQCDGVCGGTLVGGATAVVCTCCLPPFPVRRRLVWHTGKFEHRCPVCSVHCAATVPSVRSSRHPVKCIAGGVQCESGAGLLCAAHARGGGDEGRIGEGWKGGGVIGHGVRSLCDLSVRFVDSCS
jgi:hypothetical protein